MLLVMVMKTNTLVMQQGVINFFGIYNYQRAQIHVSKLFFNVISHGMFIVEV